MVDTYHCVEIKAGNRYINDTVFLESNETLRGQGSSTTNLAPAFGNWQGQDTLIVVTGSNVSVK